MAFLTPDRVRDFYGIEIKEKILPASMKPNRLLTDGTGLVQYITIHNTEDINEAKGTNDAEQYARATHNGNMSGVTVHYFIDETDCWQTLNENEVGYHSADGANGTGNGTSIAIEIIMDGSGYDYDIKAEDRGARLAAGLLCKYGLGIDKLATHNQWYPPKYCPAYILPHWDKFKAKVEKYLAEMKDEANKPVEPADNAVYRVQVGAFTEKEKAEAYAEKVKQAGFPAFVTVAGDVDGDGKVTAADAREVLRKSVGLD